MHSGVFSGQSAVAMAHRIQPNRIEQIGLGGARDSTISQTITSSSELRPDTMKPDQADYISRVVIPMQTAL